LQKRGGETEGESEKSIQRCHHAEKRRYLDLPKNGGKKGKYQLICGKKGIEGRIGKSLGILSEFSKRGGKLEESRKKKDP